MMVFLSETYFEEFSLTRDILQHVREATWPFRPHSQWRIFLEKNIDRSETFVLQSSDWPHLSFRYKIDPDLLGVPYETWMLADLIGEAFYEYFDSIKPIGPEPNIILGDN